MIVESNREKEHVSVDIYRRARGQEVDHHALGDCFESMRGCVYVCAIRVSEKQNWVAVSTSTGKSKHGFKGVRTIGCDK